MPALVVPNAAILRLLWSQGGILSAINVLGVVNGSNIAITQALTNTIGTAIKSALSSSGHTTAIGSTIALSNIGLRDIRSANQAEFLDSNAAQAGTGAGDLLPLQTCLCITLRTALAGKSFRGRCYLWGYTEGSNTANGGISSTTSSVAFVTAIKSALVASGLDLGVLSRPNATLPIPRAGTVTPVTSVVARDSVWDTQRRRAIAGV
jgi:hypothetical protein